MANHKRGRIPEKDERETPPELFISKHAQHRFTLDAAASHDNTKLARYNTKAGGYLEDGNGWHDSSGRYGHIPWSGERVWCNPPYSDIAPWVVRAWEEDHEMAYILLPNWTDRKWWLELVEPYRDGKSSDAPKQLRTEFLGRQRFLYQGLPILTEKGTVGQPEFGLVGLIFSRKESQ